MPFHTGGELGNMQSIEVSAIQSRGGGKGRGGHLRYAVLRGTETLGPFKPRLVLCTIVLPMELAMQELRNIARDTIGNISDLDR